MLKISKLIFYKKLFTFKYIINDLDFDFNKKKIMNFLKIFKILLSLKNFGLFVPSNYNYNILENNWIFPFWKKGFVSNFVNLKWFFIKYVFLKKIPSCIINLTLEKEISSEVFKKNIPLINIFEINFFKKKKNLGDYFLSNSNLNVNIDTVYFFIILLNYIKKYKNV